MKITLAKHGGLAAGIRRPATVVDCAALAAPLGQELARLVAEAKAHGSAVSEGPGRARDAMSYTITVEDSGEVTVLKASDAALPPAFAALLHWVERHRPGA
jgi:hypothetical protein